MIKYFIFLSSLIATNCNNETQSVLQKNLETGAQQFELYIQLLEGKSVGLVANHTSLINKTHLADTLISLNVNIVKIFAPEHGFRGSAGAGDRISDTIDGKTGTPVISLYGSSVKPSPDNLKGIDVMVFDIQDVGVRFYTYISTMHYVMEACAEQGIPLIILDRPDPLGHYVDGPVLDSNYKSFVGLHPVPVVYGMTVGELAGMINGEGWLKNKVKCDLTIIPCKNYDHCTYYSLPVDPSPNLNSMEAIYLYPSICFFEGTIMSLGRGTDHPFRVFGHPDFPDKSFYFIPHVNPANKNPMFLNIKCYGTDLRALSVDSLKKTGGINLEWIIKTYSVMNKGDRFFTGYFDKLAGTDSLRIKIIQKFSPDEIKRSWQPQIQRFKAIRKKYLIYKDFE